MNFGIGPRVVSSNKDFATMVIGNFDLSCLMLFIRFSLVYFSVQFMLFFGIMKVQ